MPEAPSIDDLLTTCKQSAVHLEMRDGYMRDDPMFIAWQEGRLDQSRGEADRPWLALMAATTSRGIAVRRARIVSEPISDYIRFEYDVTTANVLSGELVRWLPRRRATSLALPGNDVWLFDSQVLLLNHFDGEGNFIDHELITDPEVVKLCADAFEAVWDRSVPHEEYQPA
ncbi:DUF6879 family protein [Kitasatospora sp. NBC_01302]|uniref:DUF6879 family protein n=1 Tax=Kitasatospora sp. NBC_01302 TaxID=2903575 RepID=UPI002E1268E6|nr:DUF6879 family protein [Kitasatospora sp. NBC_01302]WSJ66542.1 hypothetical protein OG294_10620 [Kitasatospora sp. NBC_01302]